MGERLVKRSFWKDSAAQLSTELILVLAAVLAIALVVLSSLKATAESGDKITDSTAKKVLKEIK